MTERTPIYLDFETYFATDYSLRVMPGVLYVRDPRFKVHGVGIAIGDQPARWFTGDDVSKALDAIDWEHSILVGHNLLFDGLILVERYGHRPAQYFDSLYAANLALPTGIKRDLDTAGEFLGVGGKMDKDALFELRGVRDPDPAQLARLGIYCKVDVLRTRDVAKKLFPMIPQHEIDNFHITTRMGVEASIVLDEALLVTELAAVKQRRANKIDESGTDVSVLSSNDQFLELLTSLVGADEIPYKQNPKGETIPAFAKGDAQWIQFKADHPELEDLCAAREQAKSTIHVTRTKRFLELARTEQGTLPMPMKAWGAHTGRHSGTGGINVMNLPSLYRSDLRKALCAPAGHSIVVCDSEQIELRMQLWFSGQMDKHAILAAGGDLYTINAAALFNKHASFVTTMERKISKATTLGAQYRMGFQRFRGYMAGGPLGMDPMYFTDAEAQNIIWTSRSDNPMTVQMWDTLDRVLPMMLAPTCDFTIGPVHFVYEAVELPNGTFLDFTGLRPTEDGGYCYGVNGAIKFLHGGVLLENIIQALAKIVVIDQGMLIDAPESRLVGWTYDECIVVAPTPSAQDVLDRMVQLMSHTPDWAPGLVISAKGGFADNYIN
jgi:DNA polymerase bacteriophage-type